MLTFFPLLLVLLSYALQPLTCTPIHSHHRRILHQPFFPLDSFPPTQPPISPPLPKFPFSSSTNKPPFFPSYPSPPSSPTPPTLPTFPANISSLVVPQTPSRKPLSQKLVVISVLLSLFSLALILAFAFLVYQKRRNFASNKTSGSDSHRLFPANTASSDGHERVITTSSEFLYLGTLVNSRGIDGDADSSNVATGVGVSASTYQKLGSPELHPLPPLSRQSFKQNYRNSDEEEEEEEEFYSPRGSSGGKESPPGTGSSPRRVFPAVTTENFGGRSSNSSSPSYLSSNLASPTPSISNSPSPPVSLRPSFKSKLPDFVDILPPPKRNLPSPSPPSSPPERDLEKNSQSPLSISDVSGEIGSIFRQPVSVPPPPPPLPPPPRFWDVPTLAHEPISRPPVLIAPSRPVVFQNPATVSLAGLPQNPETLQKNEETTKLKLKPLHWDKVRASSDRAMVWDQLKSSSFQLNEEMIETLFVVNTSNLTPREMTRRPVLPQLNQENRVLDPKKSQNIAILLRALNVTIDEVCEALLEGNADSLGTELFESLLKMAPSKEEERKLKEYKDDSPFKLGPAERFLKALLDVPFAFKRVDAMLYIANFDSEVEYLKKSFRNSRGCWIPLTVKLRPCLSQLFLLQAACEELRNSRMFFKLLEAVLKTGNRMNVGTNRGDAHAFKLDTLLKLVDVKGTDGKTTLLHFVVQEIIRTEGSRLSGANQTPTAGKTQQFTFRDDVEFKKLGLQVVSGLSGELTNVKKVAAMDSDVLSSDVSKLARGIGDIGEVVRLNEEMGLKESSRRFSESMNGFLKRAEAEIIRIQAQESVALSLVKEITEYFHGNSAKEEAHPFRIFMVVRDFLFILDQVCKEVGKINERTIVSSARQFPVLINPTMPPVFPTLLGRRQFSSSDDESSSSP
ncbi:hypothetical protein HHK36_020019 [Tetracentron sinense]|uniref:Formin-like protein n=1 Tax=Tetracentron sinense TaxID=13715 RepID=A0A834YWD9_TETSI|nr:hypothetical protein HHK36_020019 [Tetracentron sinense]